MKSILADSFFRAYLIVGFLFLAAYAIFSLGMQGDGYFYHEYNRWWLIDGYLTSQMHTNYWAVGAGFLWLPFTLLAHGVVIVFSTWFPQLIADGIQPPYPEITLAGTVFWGVAGMWLCHLLLRTLFRPGRSFFAVVSVALASSLPWYLVVQPSFNHFGCFFTVSLFYLVWHRNRKSNRSRHWFLIGILVGLTYLSRWQNAILGVIPLVDILIGSRLERSRGFQMKLRLLICSLTGMAVGALPQLIYWRFMFRQWSLIVGMGETMTWNRSHIFHVLFSFQHGLFTWTPICLIALAGFPVLWRRDRALAAGLLAGFVLQTYVNGAVADLFVDFGILSGGPFGARRFIGTTLFTIACYAALTDIRIRSIPFQRFFSYALSLLSGGLVLWNLLFMTQIGTGMFSRDPSMLAANQVKALKILPGAATHQITQRIRSIRDFFQSPQKSVKPYNRMTCEIGSTGVCAPVSIECTSSLIKTGYMGSIRVNGIEQGLQKRGLNFVVLDPDTGRTVSSVAFNPFERRKDLASMNRWIESLPPGKIVAVAFKSCYFSHDYLPLSDLREYVNASMKEDTLQLWQSGLNPYIAFIPDDGSRSLLSRESVFMMSPPFIRSDRQDLLHHFERERPDRRIIINAVLTSEDTVYNRFDRIGLDPGLRFGLPVAAIGVSGAPPGSGVETLCACARTTVSVGL